MSFLRRQFAQPVNAQTFARLVFVALACAALVQMSSLSTRAQNPTDDDYAPPPLKRLAPEDKTKLAAARDARERTKLSVELSDERLRRAAQLTDRKDYDAAATELGFYQAIITDALKYLEQDRVPNNRQRDLFKRLELTLRAQAPRIETIRRNTPLEYAKNVVAAYEFANIARDEALDVFYDNTVLPNEPPMPKGKTHRSFGDSSAKPPKKP